MRQSLGYQIRYAYRAFAKAIAEQLEPYGITASQWSALRALWQREGLSQVELAQHMMVEKASLTAVLATLEAAGLIVRRRNSDDLRKFSIYLSPTGRRLRDTVLPLGGRINKRATRGLSAAEVEQLHVLLAKVLENLKQ
jgi:MarR family transcriptional regulator, organic hydroperoxide resistance regulator